MAARICDLHIAREDTLPTPQTLHEELPCSDAQAAGGSRSIAGVLLESHLVEGRQDITDGRRGLVYGQSVTDGCIGWDSTVAVIGQLPAAVRARRAAI